MSDAKQPSPEQINESLLDAQASEDGEQYLTFFMGGEEFGVDILRVQEIRGWDRVTPIPNSPNQVKGVMNLRGTVAPIIDLRMCFGIEDLPYTDQTVVIILKISSGSSEKIMGVVVDGVSDVMSFQNDQIRPSPNLDDGPQDQYIKGLGSTDDKMVILLELTPQLIAENGQKELASVAAV